MIKKPYQVGYGKPPEATRFKSGTSGNPKGRPKGARSFASLLDEELNKTITVVENGRRRKIKKSKAVAMAVVNKAIKVGDQHAINTIMTHSAKLQTMAEADVVISNEIDEFIIANHLKNRGSQGGSDE